MASVPHVRQMTGLSSADSPEDPGRDWRTLPSHLRPPPQREAEGQPCKNRVTGQDGHMGFLGRPPEGADFGMARGAWLDTGPHPCQAGPGPALYIHWFLNYYYFFGLFFSFNLKRRGQGQGRGARQGAAARVFTFLSRSCRLESTPGGGSGPPTPAAGLALEPPPELPSLDLILTHTRTHIHATSPR